MPETAIKATIIGIRVGSLLSVSIINSHFTTHILNNPMPLHRIFVPPNLYSEEDKQAIATVITEKVYGPLPSFYVVVIFITVEKGDYYVGAEKRDNFVRFAVENMARTFEG